VTPHGAELRGRDSDAVRPPQHNGDAPVAVNHGAGALSLDLHAQRVLHILHREAVASRRQPVHRHAQVLHAVVLDRVHVLVARNLLDQRFDLRGQLVELVQLRAEHLDRHVAAHADDHLRDAHVDRLGEAVLHARQIVQDLADLVDQRVLVCQLPFIARLEHEEGVGLVQAHGIQADLVGTCPGNHPDNLGDVAHQCLVNLQVQRREASRLTDGSFSMPTMMSPSSMVGMKVLPTRV
jgi:hypothetical protein